MLPETILFLIVMISVVSCQINGEFWWLNSDIAKFKHGTAPPPKFDDVNELDTDETAKIVFRDEVKKEKSLNDEKETLNVIHFRDETELAKPPLQFTGFNNNNNIWERPLKPMDNMIDNNSSQKTDDEFRFVFPDDDNLLWTDSKLTSNKRKSLSTDKVESSSENSFTTKISQDGKNPLIPENICSFIKKSECILKDGTLYEPWIKPNMIKNIPNTQIVCCILPITSTTIAKIIFPNDDWRSKRQKRSNEDDPVLKQRNILMNRKYVLDNQRIKLTTPATRKKVNQMVVNSDEYSIDPYWNIKNSNIRNINVPGYQDPDADYDYDSQSYSDDYTLELPKPGLFYLYSDHKQTQSTWTHNKNKGSSYDDPDSVEEEEFETSFGYSTVDPRQDHRVTSTSSKPIRRRPQKLISASSTTTELNPLSPVISFYSNPDFQILQGFKLLNLVRHKNRHVRKTAKNVKEYDNKGLKEDKNPSTFINHSDADEKHDLLESNLKQKLFSECGRTQGNRDESYNGQEQGEVETGDHPWIAMVVLTKSERSILCYATLVHSRVAVTVADCVYGKSPGAVSVIAGVQNLNDDLGQSQRRMATVLLDTDYTPGSFQHDLALLHWLRPLKLDANVHPVCLADPHSGDTCVFVGWGGYDQEMQADLRWQRASILAPQSCSEMLSKLGVSDALCAAVRSRGTVTGVGGPLLCKSDRDERWSVVAVAVWRHDIVILLPLRDWVLRNMNSLGIQ